MDKHPRHAGQTTAGTDPTDPAPPAPSPAEPDGTAASADPVPAPAGGDRPDDSDRPGDSATGRDDHPRPRNALPADPAPVADDLAGLLAAAAPRRWRNRGTVVLAAAVLLVGGFVAGAQVQKHLGATPAGTRAGTSRGVFASGFPFPSGNPFRGNTQTGRGGGKTTGTVQLVDGTTVYVKTDDGKTVIVKTNGSTKVDVNSSGSLADLDTGATVTVTGMTGDDGSVTATQITKTK